MAHDAKPRYQAHRQHGGRDSNFTHAKVTLRKAFQGFIDARDTPVKAKLGVP